MPKSRTWEVRLREGTSFSLRLGASWEVSRAFRDRWDKSGGESTWGRYLGYPGSCHCVRLYLIYTEFLVFVNLFNWFEFTKEWLIQNCLWQNYTLLWLYSSGSNIVMGLLRGRKLIEFLSNNHDSTSCKFHLPPIHVANTWPFPLLAVLRMNSQAITQYCKVPQGFEEAERRPAQSWAASLSEHAVVLLSVRGGWKVNSIQIGQQQLIVPCHMRTCQEDEHGHRTETFSPRRSLHVSTDEVRCVTPESNSFWKAKSRFLYSFRLDVSFITNAKVN